jgi:hypothetical protein
MIELLNLGLEKIIGIYSYSLLLRFILKDQVLKLELVLMMVLFL